MEYQAMLKRTLWQTAIHNNTVFRLSRQSNFSSKKKNVCHQNSLKDAIITSLLSLGQL